MRNGCVLPMILCIMMKGFLGAIDIFFILKWLKLIAVYSSEPSLSKTFLTQCLSFCNQLLIKYPLKGRKIRVDIQDKFRLRTS